MLGMVNDPLDFHPRHTIGRMPHSHTAAHPHPPVKAAIALGSNLGERRGHIESALAAISRVPGVKLIARGPIIENPALRHPNPPDPAHATDPGGAYLNTACVVLTTLDPRQLLSRLHHIERDHGRSREESQPWAPRTLDLDLLLYADQHIEDHGLNVPHPRMTLRRFVLEPLAAIAPYWPINAPEAQNHTVSEMLALLGASA